MTQQEFDFDQHLEDFEFRKLHPNTYFNYKLFEKIRREVSGTGWDHDKKCYLLRPDDLMKYMNYAVLMHNEMRRLEKEGLI